MNISIENIQSQLEKYVFEYFRSGKRIDNPILRADLGLSEDEKKRLAWIKEQDNIDETHQEEFYALQAKTISEVLIRISIDSREYTKGPRKVKILLTEQTKELTTFKKLLELGWEIQVYGLGYTCNQEEIFDDNYQIAKLILNTTHLFDYYSWSLIE